MYADHVKNHCAQQEHLGATSVVSRERKPTPMPVPQLPETDRQFHQARAAFLAPGPMREIIHRYKYDQHEFFEPLLK